MSLPSTLVAAWPPAGHIPSLGHLSPFGPLTEAVLGDLKLSASFGSKLLTITGSGPAIRKGWGFWPQPQENCRVRCQILDRWQSWLPRGLAGAGHYLCNSPWGPGEGARECDFLLSSGGQGDTAGGSLTAPQVAPELGCPGSIRGPQVLESLSEVSARSQKKQVQPEAPT